MKTFIGELILRLKDEAGDKAKKVAGDIDQAVNKIEAAGRKLSAAPWGVGFQRQLEKIGASSGDIEKLRASWDRLYADMNNKNLSKALKKSEIAGWKTATLGTFAQQHAQMRAEMDKSVQHAKKWKGAMEGIFRAGLVSMGAYTGVYAAGVGMTAGGRASAEREREGFRQETGNIPLGDRNRMNAKALELSRLYPSVNGTEVMELARNARSLMGDTDKGLEVLPEMIRGLVALQSAQTPEVGSATMRNLLRGADNLGQNGGPNGVANVKEIIAGMIRAAQIEGSDFDPGQLLTFALRTKIAGSALSTNFLATTAPAIIQDMTSNGAGTAMSTAFQAFQMASTATTNKEQIANQFKYGIRDDNGLVNGSTYSADPYQWVKETLIPQLVKNGVDLNKDFEVQKTIASFTRAPMASNLLTRMVLQRDQIDRNRASYMGAMGPEAADSARFKDPFVALESLQGALSNLAASVGSDVMPKIVSGLNTLADAINALSGGWDSGGIGTKAGILGGIGAGAFGLYKGATSIFALATAGPALNAAAVSLEAAAVSLGAAGVAGDVGGKGKGKGKGWMASLLGWAGPIGATIAAGAMQSGSQGPQDPVKQKAQIDQNMRDWLATHPMIPDRKRSVQSEWEQSRAGVTVDNPLQNAVDSASRYGAQMKDALSVTATPVVETSSMDNALAKARELLSLIGQIGTATNNLPTASDPGRQLNRSLADQGVIP